jgi:co-chaperonin GroES (HSP10)
MLTNKSAGVRREAEDRILFGKYSGSEVKLDGEEHLNRLQKNWDSW